MNVSGLKLKSAVLKLLGVVFSIVILCLTLTTLVVLTESGSRRVVNEVVRQINSSESMALTVRNVRGNLLNGVTFEQLAVDTESLSAAAGTIEISWNPFSLLSGAFIVSQVQGSDVRVIAGSGSADSVAASGFSSEPFSFQGFPIAVAVQLFSFQSVAIESSSGRLEIESLKGEIGLRGQDVTISDFQLISDPVAVNGEFQVSIAEDLPLALNIEWDYSAPIYDGFDSASGKMQISGELNSMAVSHELSAPLEIISVGSITNTVDFDSIRANFTHRSDQVSYSNAQLPLSVFSNIVLVNEYSDGQMSWRFGSDLLQAPLPEMKLSGAGNLTAEALSLSSFEVISEAGSIESTGTVNWAEDIRAELLYNIQATSPSDYLDVLLGVDLQQVLIEGSVDLAVSGNDSLSIETEIAFLDGQLNGRPLTGKGKLGMRGTEYYVDQLSFASSGNELFLTGEFNEELSLEWSLDTPNLSMVDNRLNGRGYANGSINGTSAQPVILAVAHFEELAIGSVEVGVFDFGLSGENSVYEGELSLINGRLLGDVNNQIFSEADLFFKGDSDSQAIVLNVNADLAEFQISASGGPINLTERIWAGELFDGTVTSQFGNWLTSSGSSFGVNGNSLVFETSCWRLDETEACVGGSIDEDESMLLNAELIGFPLAEFNFSPPATGYLFDSTKMPRLPQGVSVNGPAQVKFLAERPAGSQWGAEFDIDAEGLQLLLARAGSDLAEELAEPQSYDWQNLSLEGKYLNGDWFVDSQAALSENNVDDSNFQLDGKLESSLILRSDNSISGTATASFQDLGWLEAFIPELSNISGELLSSVIIDGTLNAPSVIGDATISNGKFTADRLGVTFEKFQTSISGGSAGEAELSGSVNSGDGVLEFSGQVNQLYSAERHITARLVGSDFGFINIPDLSLRLAPDLTLSATAKNIHLAGDLSIPELNLTVSELPNTAINVSKDVVVVDYPVNRPDLANSLEAENATLFDIPVTADVKVNFGSAVSFKGFGLEAGLEGSLDIQQLAAGNNLTYGELEIKDGSYEMYRQRLDISQGKLLFLGAYDNPGLDVRAIREVNDITAGVQMNGTLRNIRSQLFSTPTLADSDIISVLVTGRPFSQLGSQQDDDAVLNAITKFGLERGQGLTAQIAGRLGLDTLEITSTGNISSSELTVGKYLTPGLFVRYGIGLFDTRSKMAVDYNLSNNLILQAETGEFQSVDLTYKVER